MGHGVERESERERERGGKAREREREREREERRCGWRRRARGDAGGGRRSVATRGVFRAKERERGKARERDVRPGAL